MGAWALTRKIFGETLFGFDAFFVLIRIPALYTLGSVSLQVLECESDVTSESDLVNDSKIYRLTGACSLASTVSR